ncbi:MAG: hypothetical protein A3E01_18845 [Gammaproteobacteria bacterium RIFCSPHIGHO2_12_FULL_63_22]|nr:MAG: hypothetical protein A3E01_18845 [Gammaproteobacteria bacterium RIFCSPHIGHO2_12_FULL_63_22]
MTGKVLDDPSDGIYDDGEWIHWDWINGQIEDQELRAEFPHADIELIHSFELLVSAAVSYRDLTGRYLQIWGELGEFYAEIKYGLRRHKPHAPGSDGKIGNAFVEVKTISPEKGTGSVQVKRAGNFGQLIVVKISPDFEFEARLVERKNLRKGTGKHARLRWDDAPAAK